MKFSGKALAIVALLLPQIIWAGGKTTSLIFIENKEDLRGNKVGNLMRYEFQDGITIKKELVLSRKSVDLNLSPGANDIVSNRYLITWRGDVIDIRDKKLIHQQTMENISVVGMDQSRIILERRVKEPYRVEFYYYDLKSGKNGKLANPGKWVLPGLRSPDEKRSVTTDGTEIRLYDLSGKSTSLGTQFLSHFGNYGPSDWHVSFQIPMLWLDNDHILTQKDHGKIVILKTDGTVEPVVEIPLGESVISQARFNPELFRDEAGEIVYEFHSDDPLLFTIDLQQKSFTSSQIIWVGNGFDKQIKADSCTFRFQKNEIGYCLEGLKPWTSSSGYLAMENLDPDGAQAEIPGFKIWNKFTRKWQVFPIDALSDIIGWIED